MTIAAPESVVPLTDSAMDGERIVLEGISWATYWRLSREANQSRNRMTYDAGVLEIMSPSDFHESARELLSECVKILARSQKIPYACGGIATFRRDDPEKGFEPDQCFWLKNGSRMRGKKKIKMP